MRIWRFELARNERSRKSAGFPIRRTPGTRSTPRGSHHAVPRLCRSVGTAHKASGVSADPPPGPSGSTGWVERKREAGIALVTDGAPCWREEVSAKK